MAFENFSFPQVFQSLSLTFGEANLFSQVKPLSPRPEFIAELLDNANLASAIDTEKARSEFVVAPILLEFRRLQKGCFGLFSGIELNADSDKGLDGVCDFVITKSPFQFVANVPLMVIVQAKNDNTRTGLGQCVAAMRAAQLLNQAAGVSITKVHGATTTGSLWKFLQLQDDKVTLDVVEHYVSKVETILGILDQIVKSA